MDAIVVALRLVLTSVLLLAATAKLADRNGTHGAARSLGVPDPVAGLVPIGLPLVEVAIGALLWPVSTAAWAAVGLAVLMGIFIALVSANLVTGRRPSCHCFGALDQAPIGTGTLVRNGVLLVAAGLVAAAGHRPGADVFLGSPWIDVVAFGGLAMLAAGVVRNRPARNGTPLEDPAIPGALAIGDEAPDFVLPDVEGRDVSLATLRAGGLPVVVVFGSLRCPSCVSLLSDVERWQRELAADLTVTFIVSDAPSAARSILDGHDITDLLVQDGRAVSGLFGELPTPSAVVVDPQGRVASEPTPGAPAIRELVERLAARPVMAYSQPEATTALLDGVDLLGVGSTAPDFRLPSLAGPMLTRGDLAVGKLGFVFVQGGCVQCDDLLDELARRPDLAARAVVVSAGSLPPVVPEPLASPVLLDHFGFLATVFSVGALPSAVIIDDRAVGSLLAIGRDEVLDLLDRVADTEPITADEMDVDFIPRPRARLVTVVFEGVTILGDPSTGRFQRLDAPGRLLWGCFDGTQTLGEIAAEISAALGAPLGVVRDDVLAFARRLGRAGALDGVRPQAPADSNPESESDLVQT